MLTACQTGARAGDKMAYYLFAYFTDNTTKGQQVCYAVSANGLDFTPLNNGQPILASAGISLSGGVRDPHILRSDDGWFRMVLTDMDWQLGKWSNHGIVMLKSRDLIHWEHHAVNFHQRFAGSPFAEVNAVWAPQTIFDPTAGKYMVYFSLHSAEGGPFGRDAIYYAYANRDFSNLEAEPRLLFGYADPTIDTDIVWKDGQYHIFSTHGAKTDCSGGSLLLQTFISPNTGNWCQAECSPTAYRAKGQRHIPLSAAATGFCATTVIATEFSSFAALPT